MSAQRLRIGAHELELSAVLQEGTVRLAQPDGKSWELPATAAGPQAWLVADREGRVHLLHAVKHRAAWWIHVDGRTHVVEPQAVGARGGAAGGAAGGRVVAPMTATVVESAVEAGARVEAGTLLLVLSAMKMRLEVKSPVAGVVRHVAPAGRQVEGGEEVAVVEVDAA